MDSIGVEQPRPASEMSLGSTSEDLKSNVEFLIYMKKSFKVPLKISRKDYHYIVMKSFAIMDNCSIYEDLSFVKEMVNSYSLGLFMEI
jgi:hypothetical protein